MALKKRDITELATRVYGMLTDGQDDLSILDELGITANEYQDVKIAMFDIKAEELRRKPVEHVFIDYMIQQQSNINALSGMINDFKISQQHNALVTAVRARSEILDKIIKTGQEVGLIEKEPDKHQIVAGIAVAQLSNKELKAGITEVVCNIDELVKQFGDDSIDKIVVGEIHRGPKRKETTPEDEKEQKE